MTKGRNAPIEQDNKIGPGRLSVIAASLAEISKDSEPGFMKIGSALQSIFSDATELTRQTLETVKLIGGESDEGLLAKVGVLVKTSLKKVKDYQAAAAKNHHLAEGHVKEMTGLLMDSFGMCADLKKTAKYLRAVGLQMRVECSRTTRAMEMFSVVAQELGLLSNRFMETEEKIRGDSKSAQRGQVSAIDEMSESLHQLFRLTENTEQTIQLSMIKIERLMSVSLKTLEHAGARSRRISHHVGEIVMGIQFHDNMRQRIEHITKTLTAVEKDNIDKGSGHAWAILELQNAQLENIISEITAVHEKAADAFQEIAHEIADLMQGLSSLEAEISVLSLHRERESADPFEVLKSGLRHIQRLIDQGFSIFEYMHKTASQASNTVSALSSHMERVRQLSFETHLTAINAMVKAKQLGTEGMALDKLVQEARSVSQWANKFVAGIEKLQELIRASAAALQAQTLDKMGGGEARLTLETVIEDIAGGGAQFKAKSLDAFRRANRLEKAISDIRDHLGFLPVLAGELTRLHEQLEEVGRSLQEKAGNEVNRTDEEMDEIRKRYTMQKERKVHAEYVGLKGDPKNGGGKFCDTDDVFESLFDTTDKGSGLGDNVELF